MLDLGWTELMVIAVVAVIVIGPKDLPRAMRTVARFVRKARSLAGDFQRQFDDVVREWELDEVRNTIRDMRGGGLKRQIENAVDPGGEMRRSIGSDPYHEPGPVPTPEPGPVPTPEPRQGPPDGDAPPPAGATDRTP